MWTVEERAVCYSCWLLSATRVLALFVSPLWLNNSFHLTPRVVTASTLHLYTCATVTIQREYMLSGAMGVFEATACGIEVVQGVPEDYNFSEYGT